MVEIVKYGTITISAGEDNGFDAHGLSYTPDKEKVSITPHDELNGRDFWLESVDATNVTVKISMPEPPEGPDHIFGYRIFK